MEQASELQDEFARAAADFDVPVGILKAVAFAMTRWHMVEGEVEFAGRDARMGIMGVPEVHLDDLAARLNTVPSEVAFHRETNIRAAATRLTELANGQGIDRSDLGAWAPVVAEYAEVPDEEGTAALVHNEVYALLREGLVTELGSIDAIDTRADYRQPTSGTSGGDNRGAIWRPSPNQSSRSSSGGTPVDPVMIVIHTCEGSYSGCWGWLTNPGSGVSAHYVVNSDGSEVSQLVRESSKAWHVGATYDCDHNAGTDCWRNGDSTNQFTVGIEHAGYGSQSSWASGLLDRSAQLVCDIAADWDIPIDRYHVVGHGQLQPYDRVDPGPNWPWTDYLSRAAGHCGGSESAPEADPDPEETDTSTVPARPAVEIVIDSNNDANGAYAELQLSSWWTSSNNVAGYYNTGYWWRSTASDADGASFWFYLESPARITADAWWSEAVDRSRSAPFIAYDSANQQLGTVYVDQHRDGGRWVELGTWNFPAGWNRIVLSRWTTPGYVVVADAVRVRSAE
jgi:N-acetyl-anhydromuramyl-L-alanine amidase AmpD